MANFEKIVRPFETGTPFTSRRLAPTPPTPEELGAEPEPNPLLVWGGQHPGDFQPFESGPTGWTKSDNEVSDSRKTSDVRVYQNNDESSPNYVDIKRTDEITMERNDGSRYTMTFENITYNGEG